MLAELIAGVVLKAIGLFVAKAEEKAAWEKAIRARLAELDKHSADVGQLHQEYDRMQDELRKGASK